MMQGPYIMFGRPDDVSLSWSLLSVKGSLFHNSS